MTTTGSEIDYQLEWLQAGLASATPGSGQCWQEAFETARDGWQLEQAQRLLRLVKGMPLDRRQRSVARFLEGTLLVRQGHWQAARDVFEDALVMKRAVGDRQGETAVLNALAGLLRRLGQSLDEVIALHQEALALLPTADDPKGDQASDLAATLTGLGLAYYAKGNLAEAISCHRQALELAQALADPAIEAVALHNLGSVAWAQGRLDDAEAFFTRSLALQQTARAEQGRAETFNSLGLVAEARGNWDQAGDYYRQSLTILQRFGDWYGQVQVLTNLANVVSLQDAHDAGEVFHLQALAIAQDLGDAMLEGQVLTGLGDAYRKVGRFDESEKALLLAIARKGCAGDERGLKHTQLMLGALYHAQGHIDEALSVYEQALALACTQSDTRVEAFTLLDMGKLAALKQDWGMAQKQVRAAEKIALAGDFRDCLAAIYQVLGDMERFADQPDAQGMLRNYVEALAYAADVNEATLQGVLDYLLASWSAHAEDGHADEAIWFCERATELWLESGMADHDPAVGKRLQELAGRLKSAGTKMADEEQVHA